MMEIILATVVMVFAAAGLGLGLLLGRGPALTSCSAASCLPEGRCADCPMRRSDRDVPE